MAVMAGRTPAGRPATGRLGYHDLVRLIEVGDADGVADAVLAIDEPRRRALVPYLRGTDLDALAGRTSRSTPAASPGTELTPATSPGTDLAPATLQGTDLTPASSAGTDLTPTARAGTELAPGASAGTDLTPTACAGPRLGPPDPAGAELPPAEDAGARPRLEAALLVAGAGCLPRAADVVSWLRSKRFRTEPTDATVALILRVLAAPGRPRLADVARGLSERLRGRDCEPGEWALTAAAVRAAGLPPPAGEAFVLGWVRRMTAADPDLLRPDSGPLADESVRFAARLGGDSWLDDLLPALLEQPRVAARLGPGWPAAFAVLAGTGRIDRAALLALLVRRLRSGDRGAAMRPVLATYRLLDPTLDERAGHRADLLAMLATGSGPVAETAQRALRGLDEAGRLEAAAVVEAGRAVLARGEKKLIRAQLTWLDRAAARHPEVAAELLATIAARIGADGDDLAGRKLRVLGRHPGVTEALRPVADHLGGDLRRQADELLGEVSVPAAPRFPPASVPYAAARLTLGRTPAALAAEVAAACGPEQLERVLAGTVTLAAAGPDRPAEALAGLSPGSPLQPLLAAVTGGRVDAAVPAVAPPQRMVLHRIAELAGQLAAGHCPPALLATPATVDGHVEPARLLFRLAEAERDGWQPGRHDLTQALLRLPRTVDPAVATAATRLGSPAGRRFAAWLRHGGLADPVVTLPRPGAACARTAVVAPAAPDVPADLLTGGPAAPDADPACWPMVLPSHRELVAVHLLTVAPGTAAPVLPALARASGPFGPATARVLAYGLAAGHDSAGTAVAHLARHGGLDAGLLGRELALLVAAEASETTRRTDPGGAADVLADLARGGAQHAVWTVLRTVVPALLRLDRPPPAVPDLLALATATAAAIGVRDDLPEVSAVAARPERTRLKNEAARLARTLRA